MSILFSVLLICHSWPLSLKLLVRSHFCTRVGGFLECSWLFFGVGIGVVGLVCKIHVLFGRGLLGFWHGLISIGLFVLEILLGWRIGRFWFLVYSVVFVSQKVVVGFVFAAFLIQITLLRATKVAISFTSLLSWLILLAFQW